MHPTDLAAGLAHAAMLARYLAIVAPAPHLHEAAALWLGGAWDADPEAAAATANRVAAQLLILPAHTHDGDTHV